MMKTISDSLDEAMEECETIGTILHTQLELEDAANSTVEAGQHALEAATRLGLRASTDNFSLLVDARWGYFDQVSTTIRLRRHAVEAGHATATPSAMSLPLDWNSYFAAG